MSVKKFPPPAPDSSVRSYPPSVIPERDTIRVYIESINYLASDSTLFEFNFDFVRFWGTKIMKSPHGYYYYWEGDYDPKYILKYPIKRGNKWTNRLLHQHDDCEITSVDTTITVADQHFQNCIEITINRVGQVSSHMIKMYLNEKYGFLYYKDYDSADEIVLIKVEKVSQ